MALLASEKIAAAELKHTFETEIAAVWDPVEIDFLDPPTRLQVSSRLASIGPLSVVSSKASRHVVTRSEKRRHRDREPFVFCYMQVSGGYSIEHDARSSVLRRGDMLVYDNRSPYRQQSLTATQRTHSIRIPRSLVPAPEKVLRAALGRPLRSRQSPLVSTSFGYLHSLLSGPLLESASDAAALTPVVTELIGVLCETAAGPSARIDDSLDATLRIRVVQFVRDHVADPDLTPASIAAAHHVSVRHLYGVMAGHSVSLHDLIQGLRLASCRRDLADPLLVGMPVWRIAHRWGFTGPSHFSRVFREAYGMTPREWRTMTLSTANVSLPR
jgi:AraC-like DNA-binding protein